MGERDCGRRIKARAYDRTGARDKVSSMCGHESHCDSKIEAARHRKVDLDCYSCHQSAERLRVLELPHRQGDPEEYMPRRAAPGSSLSEAPARVDMTSFIARSLAR